MILAKKNVVKWVLLAAACAAGGLVACDGADSGHAAPEVSKRAVSLEQGSAASVRLESEREQFVAGSTGLLTQLPKELWKAYPFDSECCTEPGQFDNCWFRDAELDGTTCEDDDDCAAGQSCSVYGLCTCQTDADCNDGVCNEAKICGPSWCNGHFVCSCFGGCQWWQADDDYTPEQLCAEQGLSCCDGRYSYHPDLVPGDTPMPGYCTDSGDCELRCRIDAECNDGNACTVDTCTNENACGEDERGCSHTIIDGLDCDGAVGDAQSSQCAQTVCRDVDPDPCVVDAQCVAEPMNIGGVCTENPQIPGGWHGEAARAGDGDGSSCFTLACDGLGQCAAEAVDDAEALACDDEDYLATGAANPCTDELCVAGACAHVADAHVGEACEHDNDLCTAGQCAATGACEHDEAGDVECLVDQCNLSSCNPVTGLCEFNNDARFGVQCNLDTNGCTTETCQCADPPCSCVGGSCEEELDCIAESEITCPSDGNTCTSDVCRDDATVVDPHAYSCPYTAQIGQACDADGNGCTAGDVCAASGDSAVCEPGDEVDCVSELAVAYGAVDLDCNEVSCEPDAVDPDVYACVFSHDLTVSAGGCNADGDGCTLDVCDVEAVPALQVAPATCQVGDSVECEGMIPHSQCQSVDCATNPADHYDYSCETSDLEAGTGCEDGDACTAGDACDGAGVCVAGADPCVPANVCSESVCAPSGGSYVCNESVVEDCCLDDGDCVGTACPSKDVSQGGCSEVNCNGSSECECTAVALGTECTDYSQADYPPNCYDGKCDVGGNCVPAQHPAYNNLCSDAFDPSDRTAIDTTGDWYLGEIANTAPSGTMLTVTGSTTCAYNNYRALGDECNEYDGATFTRDIGTGGRDLVYAFRYQANEADQYELSTFIVKVQANFNVSLYVADDIVTAADCPEGDNPSADDPAAGGFHGDVDSRRCNFPYDLGVGLPPPTVIEDECDSNGNEIRSQECCDPCIEGFNCGYYWCKRGYNFNGSACDMCAGVNPSSPPAGYDPNTYKGNCDALWTYPVDPFNCDKTVPEGDSNYDDYTSVASTTISPNGEGGLAGSGQWKTVFIFVDGTNDTMGDFYLTVEKRTWWSSPCDRVNDDMRVYDVTHPAGGEADYKGSLEDVVNSMHSGGGGVCGGYDCRNTAWGGVTGKHQSGYAANQFWPAAEHFKIHRQSGEGRSWYCFRTNESVADAADLVVTLWSRLAGWQTICDAWYYYENAWRNNWGGNVKVELRADAGTLYFFTVSERAYRNRPCRSDRGDNCNYSITVTEGRCP